MTPFLLSRIYLMFRSGMPSDMALASLSHTLRDFKPWESLTVGTRPDIEKGFRWQGASLFVMLNTGRIMADILCFSRNRCTTVEQIDERTMRSTCRVQDPLMDAFVEVHVRLPDLEISGAFGKIRRSAEGTPTESVVPLDDVLGVRIGPGLKKILKGLLGSSAAQEQLVFMLEECCGGVILSFTKDVLLSAPKDKLAEKDYFENVVRSNPRLYNSCAALAPGSPLVEGIEPPR
jgi:hypothetical protein